LNWQSLSDKYFFFFVNAYLSICINLNPSYFSLMQDM